MVWEFLWKNGHANIHEYSRCACGYVYVCWYYHWLNTSKKIWKNVIFSHALAEKSNTFFVCKVKETVPEWMLCSSKWSVIWPLRLNTQFLSVSSYDHWYVICIERSNEGWNMNMFRVNVFITHYDELPFNSVNSSRRSHWLRAWMWKISMLKIFWREKPMIALNY